MPPECVPAACSLYGSPHLHRDRRAQRRLARSHSARLSRHRFVHARFRIGPPSPTRCVSSHLCGVLIHLPPRRDRSSARQPVQNTAERGRNAEQPGVILDYGGKRARRPFRPPSPAKYCSTIRIQSSPPSAPDTDTRKLRPPMPTRNRAMNRRDWPDEWGQVNGDRRTPPRLVTSHSSVKIPAGIVERRVGTAVGE